MVDIETPLLLEQLLSPEQFSHISDLDVYINNSFGNDVRIDYGTGHETNLVIFLHNLMKLSISMF